MSDLHFVPHAGKDGGLDEIAPIPNSPAAAPQLRTFLLAGFDIAHHLVELRIVNLWPLFGVGIEWITDGATPGAIHAALDELVVRLALHEQS